MGTCEAPEKDVKKAPETHEVVVCGHTKVHGGRYEWVCFLPPQHPKKKHSYLAFKVA